MHLKIKYHRNNIKIQAAAVLYKKNKGSNHDEIQAISLRFRFVGSSWNLD
jgi:hypothetical protein